MEMPDDKENLEKVTYPSWLDKSFLKATLNSSECNNISVTSYEVSKATAAGDNYASDMYRVQVHFKRKGQDEEQSLIVKAIPAKEEMSKVILESNVFQRESKALSVVVPKIHDLVTSVAPGNIPPFSAKCVYSQWSPPAIVMEDLKEKGFKMATRTVGLDLKHSLLVIGNIARYHAGSVALHEQHPELFEMFYESVFCEKMKTTLESFFGSGMKNLVKEVESSSEYKDSYLKKLGEMHVDAADIVINSTRREDNEFNVFIHGDLWLNNMMFCYSDVTGEVVDVRFVDFQLSHFGSPAQDIQYFLHTSVSLELLDKHQMLVEEYYKILADTLKILGYKHLIPSMKQLQKQMDNKGQYAVIVAATVLPIVYADKDNIPDFDKVIKQEESVHFSERYKKALKQLLPEFERKGWI